MKLSYYKELDGVRAIAAIMVMIFHFFQQMETSNPTLLLFKKISIFGQTGVSLFFVLSGFLITRILFSSKANSHFFSNFYIRRTLRIFPLYYLFLGIYYFLIPVLSGASIVDFGSQVYYWIYLQDFAMTFNWKSNGPSHFWSLAIEEHFYLFWPFVIYYLSNKKIIISIIAIIAVSFLVRIFLIGHQYRVFYFTFSRMDELAAGAFLAVLEINKQLTSKHSGIFLLLFLGVIIPTAILWAFSSGTGDPILQVFKYFLLAISYFSLIAYVITIRNKHILKKILIQSPLSYTGKISYGLYVYHPMCFMIFRHFFETNFIIVNVIGSFLTAYIVATISYLFFESKFLKLKKYFNNYNLIKSPSKAVEIIQ